MLESFEIVSTSGVVLWSRYYSNVSPNIVNGLIRNVFIEDRLPAEAGTKRKDDSSATQNPVYKQDGYMVKWTTAKDLGLVFVAVYQSLMHISWIDKLLDSVKIIFTKLYGNEIGRSRSSIIDCKAFDPYFEQRVKELEKTQSYAGAAKVASKEGGMPIAIVQAPDALEAEPKIAHTRTISAEASPAITPDTSRPSTPSGAATGVSLPKGASRREKKLAAAAKLAASNAVQSSGDESRKSVKKAKSGKKGRKWNAEGLADEEDDVTLDYSATSGAEGVNGGDPSVNIDAINADSFGTRTRKGEYILKDLDNEINSMLRGAEQNQNAENQVPGGVVGTGINAISGLFRNVVGGKVLTEQDLEKPIKAMEEHLVKKNVAQEAARKLCEVARKDLVGVKTGSFESVDATLRSAMNSSLQKILTPTTSLDLLRAIAAVNKPSSSSTPRRPYVISIVGVNGVGKSTNLSKIAYFLLQNDLQLLIAACDTFRSGAVEQLRVHARNLAELSERDQRGSVELYERGYGKDAANIAKDAVAYAASKGLDVVLIDTAGRRHNDQRLMAPLEKFNQLAKPDKILMVGEALVGSDSVAQARNFNAAFGGRRLDGFIISKCDTVGDMVGSLVSMVHATGIPVVFLGVGQHYGDLRTLNVPWAVGLLMQ